MIGIVASRLVERFQRPTVLVALDGERGRGSGRSLPGLDLNAHARRLRTICSRPTAGTRSPPGSRCARERLPELRARSRRWCASASAPEDCVPRLAIDAEVRLWRVRPRRWSTGSSGCRRTGSAIPSRCSWRRGVAIEAATAVGGGKHLRMTVRDATGARRGDRLRPRRRRPPRSPRRAAATLAFVPTRNEWMGEPRIQLKLKGVRAA